MNLEVHVSDKNWSEQLRLKAWSVEVRRNPGINESRRRGKNAEDAMLCRGGRRSLLFVNLQRDEPQ